MQQHIQALRKQALAFIIANFGTVDLGTLSTMPPEIRTDLLITLQQAFQGEESDGKKCLFVLKNVGLQRENLALVAEEEMVDREITTTEKLLLPSKTRSERSTSKEREKKDQKKRGKTRKRKKKRKRKKEEKKN